ncbi:uncharacterized protein BDR25DRAFT_288469 [Lindgomyces ingoldianus]|uniref:Uncharacterized protein n=1 Tax=Lindgomyces ingoldianus TaxID=673940 RepID=A0ACB6QRT6_9PLEO|nr:uncharacterized protein BDR25DRAFT_288469 [Lindgomyces ingoldianus]KAF2469562.1 hypothetical protein BDR25DRAFT_288469 [Lindgomyces ingoldianus]
MSLNAAFDLPKGNSPPVLLSKTCQNCFLLKIRCDRTQRNDICDRCARLGKHCVFRPARRRDNSAKRDSRIQALEAQVQQLLSTRDPVPPLPPIPSSSSDSAPPASVASPHSSYTRSEPPDGDVIDVDILTIERADTLVEMYKSDMMPHFPFIIIPPHVTGSSMRHEKPFLFLALLSVACFHDLPTQDRLGDRFKYMVSDKVLLGGDDSLSLEYLQGLLVVLAWNQYHHRSKYYSQYLQLAISIAVDMRLDRRPIRSKGANAGRKRDVLAIDPATQVWGSEEQRAAAGIFYLSSTISKLLDKLNTFPCTQYIEEGCLSLRQKAEYGTDKDLYHVIRLQRIIESIETLSSSSSSETEAHAAYLRTRSELEEFRVYLCSDVSDSHLLFMQFHTAKLFLYQVAFFERSLQQSPALNLSILCEGLESAKSFLDLYLWLPPKSEMALTNSEWIQLSFGVTLAAKFAIVSKDPNVEPQTRELRHRLNIENVFRHLALRIGALVGRATDGKKEKDIFVYYEARVRKIQTWYERMVRATGSDSPTSQQVNLSPPQQHPTPIPGQRVPHPGSSGSTSTPSAVATPPFSPQPNAGYGNVGMTTAPFTSAGMTSMSTHAGYGAPTTVPQLAFIDLMAAPGWDMPFVVPMEQDPWAFDIPVQYQGSQMQSPPSDGQWGSPSSM